MQIVSLSAHAAQPLGKSVELSDSIVFVGRRHSTALSAA